MGLKHNALFLIPVLILACASMVAAKITFISGPQAGAGGAATTTTTAACNTEEESCWYTKDTHDANVGDLSGRKYVAGRMVFGGTNGSTICKIVIYADKEGSPTQNYYASIWSHDSGEDDPDTIIGDESDAVNGASFPADFDSVTFSFSGSKPTLTNGTVYWIVLRADGIDASNYINWADEDSECEAEHTD